jgi:hypothetical protein
VVAFAFNHDLYVLGFGGSLIEDNAFFRKTEIEKADLLGERVVSGATEAATIITAEMGKRYNIGFRDCNGAQQFLIEVIVFYMHLVDVFALGILGLEKREIFGDRLIVAVIKELLQVLSREVSTDDFGKALLDTYNRRQIEYSRYKILIPEKDQPLKNTLYWEFSKILFGMMEETEDTNPTTLMLLNILLADMTNVMLNEALNVEEVLRS